VKGTAQLTENNEILMTPEVASNAPMSQSLRGSVRESLQGYFTQLDGQTPANLYGMVMAEVEKPLIEMVLKLTNGNQSKAAIILGISRGTLRKKMAIYDIH
jgi:Fis family transcriptional regulator, factor for inversion stimulation protein